MVIASEWGVGQVLWSMVCVVGFIIWIALAIHVFRDIFVADRSGWLKAAWAVLIVALPIVGVILYLIVYGGEMNEYALASGYEKEARTSNYVRQTSW